MSATRLAQLRASYKFASSKDRQVIKAMIAAIVESVTGDGVAVATIPSVNPERAAVADPAPKPPEAHCEAVDGAGSASETKARQRAPAAAQQPVDAGEAGGSPAPFPINHRSVGEIERAAVAAATRLCPYCGTPMHPRRTEGKRAFAARKSCGREPCAGQARRHGILRSGTNPRRDGKSTVAARQAASLFNRKTPGPIKPPIVPRQCKFCGTTLARSPRETPAEFAQRLTCNERACMDLAGRREPPVRRCDLFPRPDIKVQPARPARLKVYRDSGRPCEFQDDLNAIYDRGSPGLMPRAELQHSATSTALGRLYAGR